MSENEYKELIDFLGKQLEQIHDKIDQTNTNLGNKIEETKRHTGVLIEDVNHRLDLIVEGLMGTQDGRKKDKIENEREHSRLENLALINTADISSLDQRVVTLEGKSAPQ